MSGRVRVRLLLLILLLIAAAVFSCGIDWGLPSRKIDPLLFGDEPVWSGQKIASLAPPWIAPNLGADVDINPLGPLDAPLVINQTDAQRAEIIRRYRLYSAQPDEMITFRALSGMQPGKLHLDPKLYQYGGLWIYPVGALLKIASMVGAIELRNDLNWYLDHPEGFGPFYIVARCYSVMWGMAGVWAVFCIVQFVSDRLLAAAAASLCYIFMPVVVNMAHEAKPHLAGAVLMLLAGIATMKFIQTSKSRWWVLSGALCGGASGMVVSAVLSSIMIPIMVLLSDTTWRRRIVIALAAGCIGIAVYFVTNPYVAIHLLGDAEILKSNFANSAAMYQVGRWREGFVNAIRLIGSGASWAGLIFGGVGLILILARASRLRLLLPLLVSSLIICIQFVALAAGKPAEYARFAILPDVVLGIAAILAIDRLFTRNIWRAPAMLILVGAIGLHGLLYCRAFIRDSSSNSSRFQAARRIDQLLRAGHTNLEIFVEPAPYSLPPVNLFEWRISLTPRTWTAFSPAKSDVVVVRAIDSTGPFSTPITWAHKQFQIHLQLP